MPVERNPGGSTTVTGNAILGMRGMYCLQAIEVYLSSGGRMQLTRVATPANLRAIASEFTGKKYARSQKGLTKARDDLKALMEKKNLDELGETRQVNQAVGGVAADLEG